MNTQNLLIHCPAKPGFNRIFDVGEYNMKLTGFGLLVLRAGESRQSDTGSFEVALVLLGGKCRVTGDGFDFADTTLISKPRITEQAFVDFLSLLPYAADASVPLDTMFRRASADPAMFFHFVSLGEKYLAGRWSPMRDEDLYIDMLRVLGSGTSFPAGESGRARFRLEMALKNRPGEPATDFGYVLRDGRCGSLYGTDAEYLIVFFNDPGCAECREVRSGLENSSDLARLLGEGRVRILSLCVSGNATNLRAAIVGEEGSDGWIDAFDEAQTVYAERLYDLQSLPVLYLLDSDKRVLLKDATVEQIVDALGR